MVKLIKQYDSCLESKLAPYVLFDATDNWKWMIVQAGWSNEMAIHVKSYVKTMPRNWTLQ